MACFLYKLKCKTTFLLKERKPNFSIYVPKLPSIVPNLTSPQTFIDI